MRKRNPFYLCHRSINVQVLSQLEQDQKQIRSNKHNKLSSLFLLLDKNHSEQKSHFLSDIYFFLLLSKPRLFRFRASYSSVFTQLFFLKYFFSFLNTEISCLSLSFWLYVQNMYVYGLTIAVVRAISILCHLCVIISTKNFSFFFIIYIKTKKEKNEFFFLLRLKIIILIRRNKQILI